MLKRIMIYCFLASMNLSAMNEESYFGNFFKNASKVVELLFADDEYADLYTDKKRFEVAPIKNQSQSILQKNQPPVIISASSNKDLQNVLLVISFLERTKDNKTVQRKLTQADISSQSRLNTDGRVEKLLHQKAYKKKIINIPSHR